MTTQYQQGRNDGYQLGYRSAKRASDSPGHEAPPMLRLPISNGEFLAWWPDDATSADLELMRTMFVTLMLGWIGEVSRREINVSAAETEYASWMELLAQAQQGDKP